MDALTKAAQDLERLRAENKRMRAIVEAATDFVMAHCALEFLAGVAGPDIAADSPANDKVIDAHMRLEDAVLGERTVPGRRKHP